MKTGIQIPRVFSAGSSQGDTFCKTAMSRRENVPGCIHIAVVYRAAIAASPSRTPVEVGQW